LSGAEPAPAQVEPDAEPVEQAIEPATAPDSVAAMGGEETPAGEPPPAEVPAAEPAPPEPEPVPESVPAAREAAIPPAQTLPAPPVAVAQGEGSSAATGNDILDTFMRQLEADPENDVLRLSVARVSGQIGLTDLAVRQYRHLIKYSRLLDDVVVELQDLITYNDDRQVLQRLHRTLGDAYSKQGRLREAIDAYSWRN
jgi:hypothetical protein